jgi:uncharacterized protein YqjF (DUF2071 family)
MTVDPRIPGRSADRPPSSSRPRGLVVMRQNWWDLLFLHWAVPESSLRPLIPDGLRVDTFEGRAYVGLVPFGMSGVRPVFLPPIPGLSRFLEVNVRTYVRRDGGDPGVWFFSLDAANRVAVAVARHLFHLPYHYARMHLERRLDRDGPSGTAITYTSRRVGPVPAGCAIQYTPTGTPGEAEPGTLEHFLIERYVLYARRRAILYTGRVYHRPYGIQSAEVSSLDESLIEAAGIKRPDEPPLVHYAAGVRVGIGPPRRVSP